MIHKEVNALKASFDQNYARQNDFFLRASGEWQTISQAYDSQTDKVGELRRSVRKPDQEFGNLIDLVEKGAYDPSLHFAQLKPEEFRRSIVVPIYVAKDTLAVFLYQDFNSN